jgi:hypothetical protein
MIAARAAHTVPRATRRSASASLGGRFVPLGILSVVAAAGCSENRTEKGLTAPYSQCMTIAVAPAINFSGSSHWDPMRMGDLMASELSQVPGINVVGVNRVLAVLARQGRDSIVSPAHALEVCDQLGVDAILVFAITEYDPYDPPVVGLATQLYGPRPRNLGFDPVATSRQARPFPTDNLANDALRPWAQVQRTFNAAHESVQKAVESYGRPRDAEHSPMGWRKYVASQELYMRFCCHSVLCELMQQEQSRVIAESVALTEPMP